MLDLTTLVLAEPGTLLRGMLREKDTAESSPL